MNTKHFEDQQPDHKHILEPGQLADMIEFPISPTVSVSIEEEKSLCAVTLLTSWQTIAQLTKLASYWRIDNFHKCSKNLEFLDFELNFLQMALSFCLQNARPACGLRESIRQMT